MKEYVETTIRTGRLHDEIERMRQILVRLHKTPDANKESQMDKVQHATKVFRALLAAKETQQKTVAIE
jgi:hypothetical protein